MPDDAVLQRIRGEYLEMPGLRLTLPQAQRLCGVDSAVCQRVFYVLVETGFLCVRADGSYARPGEGLESTSASGENGPSHATRFAKASRTVSDQVDFCRVASARRAETAV
jgi:hypothetical protein